LFKSRINTVLEKARIL